MPDLTELRANWLVDLLDDPNLTVRVLASERLTTLLGTGASVATSHLDLLKAAIASTANDDAAATRKAHAMWLLERATPGGLPRDMVERLANDPSRLVRVHLVKALTERDDWSTSADLFTLVRAKLKDADPFVRRAAADALGRHPAAENVEPLLALWAETPADDTHLIHTVRIALRDQLLPAGSYGPLAALLTAKPEHAAKVADVSLGVRNAESAAYLLSFAETHALDDAPLAEYLHDAVRYATDEQFADAMRRAQAVAAGSYARQQSALLSLAKAAQERGKPVPTSTGDWAGRVATVLLAQPDRPSVDRGIELARQLHVSSSFDALGILAGRESKLPEVRGAALDGCVAIDGGRALPIAPYDPD